jgi:hypothetical protein
VDAATLIAMLVRSAPASYMEIGSGYSTRFARHAIQTVGLSTVIASLDDSNKSSSLITIGLVKVDIGPLRAVFDKFGAPVLKRIGPIIDRELFIFEQKQMIRQLRNLEKFGRMFQETKARRNLSAADDVSPSISEPIIDAAMNEEREELRNIWAKLLAAAVDPQRKGLGRHSIIASVKNWIRQIPLF